MTPDTAENIRSMMNAMRELLAGSAVEFGETIYHKDGSCTENRWTFSTDAEKSE